jgi:hypothetical protein
VGYVTGECRHLCNVRDDFGGSSQSTQLDASLQLLDRSLR